MSEWLYNNALYLLLMASVVISVFWLINFREDLRVRWYACIIIALLTVTAGVIGAMLMAKFENLIAGSGDGVISLYGALFLTPLMCLLGAVIFRRPLKATMDVLTLPIVCAATVSRIHCMIKGCCLGVIIPGTEFRVPTRETELVFDIVFIIIIARITAKKRYKGYNYPLYLLCYGALRFILQWFREGGFIVIGSLTLSHIWSILSAAIGGALILILYLKGQKHRAGQKKHEKSETTAISPQ